MNDLSFSTHGRRMPERVEQISGRAAFDRELSALSRREGPDVGTLLPWPFHRIDRPKPTKPPPAPGCAAHKEAAVTGPTLPVPSAYDRRRRRIWDMIADGMPGPAVGAALGIGPSSVVAAILKGRPPGAYWHDVRPDDLRPCLGDLDERTAIADLMNAAARRWDCPAQAIFGRDDRSVTRIRSISAARAEMSVRLRIGRGLSLLRCGALLRLHHCSIIAGIRRAAVDDRFAFLRAELEERP